MTEITLISPPDQKPNLSSLSLLKFNLYMI